MYPTSFFQFFLEQCVDHSVSRRLQFRLESLGCNDQAEMGFSGDATLHGFVMSMHVGVIVDFESGRLQRLVDLVTCQLLVWRLMDLDMP